MSLLETGSHISDVLDLFRTRGELSRTEVMEISGLSRSTVNQRLTSLLAGGLITPLSGGESTGGRPSSRFALNAERAIFLTADIGASGFTVAVCDLSGTALRHTKRSINVWEGPDLVLGEVHAAFEELRG
ncbi:MAG: winged helix-turn-helix domain-containing protein, partial [Mycetocola sp.]